MFVFHRNAYRNALNCYLSDGYKGFVTVRYGSVMVNRYAVIYRNTVTPTIRRCYVLRYPKNKAVI